MAHRAQNKKQRAKDRERDVRLRAKRKEERGGALPVC
jgi:hypothetical protein